MDKKSQYTVPKFKEKTASSVYVTVKIMLVNTKNVTNTMQVNISSKYKTGKKRANYKTETKQ